MQPLIKILQLLGYEDKCYPKVKKNLNYEKLDLKSIRVINRLAKQVFKDINPKSVEEMYLICEQYFKEQIQVCNIKTHTRQEKTQLIDKDVFYRLLEASKIRKSAGEIHRLTTLL